MDLLADDTASAIRFTILSPMGRDLTASLTSNPESGFFIASPSTPTTSSTSTTPTTASSNTNTNSPTINDFSVRSRGNLSDVVAATGSATLTLVVSVSDSAAECRPVNASLVKGPCMTTLTFSVRVALLQCPSSMTVVIDDGSAGTVVAYADAVPNAAYGRVLSSSGWTVAGVAAVPQSGLYMELGLHTVG